MKIYCFVLSALFLTGCSMTIPLNWASEKEAYPGNTALETSSPGSIATRQTVLNYTYADVFVSAESAMSYAQINITRSDMALGTINTTRSSLVGGYSKRFYYLMKIEEEGPERCKVSIYSKQQQSGKYNKWIPNVVLPGVGLGALALALGTDAGTTIAVTLAVPVIMTPLLLWTNGTAKKGAQLKWSPDDDEYLDRVMSFMRSDLLQKNN